MFPYFLSRRRFCFHPSVLKYFFLLSYLIYILFSFFLFPFSYERLSFYFTDKFNLYIYILFLFSLFIFRFSSELLPFFFLNFSLFFFYIFLHPFVFFACYVHFSFVSTPFSAMTPITSPFTSLSQLRPTLFLAPLSLLLLKTIFLFRII